MTKNKATISLLALLLVLSPILLSVASNWRHTALAAENTPDKQLLLFDFWGFGDFRDTPCSAEDSGKLLPVPKGHQMSTWSGCSKEWASDGVEIRDYNTLVIHVEGADTIKFSGKHDQKMMKWFVQWPGMGKNETLICQSADLRSSSDREWVLPVSGTFEYSLPEGAIKAGMISKIGFVLMEGASYGDVRFRVWFAVR